MSVSDRRPARTLAAVLVAALAALPASDAAAEPTAPEPTAPEPTARERKIRLAAIAGAIALYVATETVAKDAVSPDTCRWCSVGSLDDAMRDLAVWDDRERERARRLSNYIGYAASPIVAAGLLLTASRSWTAYGDDITAMFEVVVGTQLVTQLAKGTAGRQRPYAHYRTQPAPVEQEENLSFFSGHSSLTFSIAVGAGVIAQRRGYRLAPAIWTTGLAIAATTAYLRMAADRHYFTDVVVGSAMGALGGALIPRLTGSLPPRVAVAPQPGGLALVGRF